MGEILGGGCLRVAVAWSVGRQGFMGGVQRPSCCGILATMDIPRPSPC